MILGIDWGSSSVRAMRIGEVGEALETRRAADGVFTRAGDFEARLAAHLGDWLERYPSAPIVMCGMIGSDRGWVHAPYVGAPCGPADLAKALVRVPFGRPAFIVPGISHLAGEMAEVMRGEETLIAGLLQQEKITRATICLPGTHSKWVDVEDGRIMRFRTYMTGELRAMVLARGALATDVPQHHSPGAFAKGIAAAGSGVIHALFQARARRLLARLPESHVGSFVSGLLVGDEIAHETPSQPFFLVARDAIAADYQRALGTTPHRLVDPEPLAALGLSLLGRLGLKAQ
jgi:2-dehydro-3-deoxygalactonokinase